MTRHTVQMCFLSAAMVGCVTYLVHAKPQHDWWGDLAVFVIGGTVGAVTFFALYWWFGRARGSR